MLGDKNSHLLRFPLIGMLMLMTTYFFGERMVSALMPMYQWEISLLDHQFRTAFFGIVDIHGALFLKLDILFSGLIFTGDHHISPVVPVKNTATLPLGYVLLPVVLLGTVILAWPVKAIAEVVYRLVFGLPLLVLVMLLDVPLQFVYMIWDGIQTNFNPAATSENALLYWSNFLNGGGQIALSIACGLIAVGCADYCSSYLIMDESHGQAKS